MLNSVFVDGRFSRVRLINFVLSFRYNNLKYIQTKREGGATGHIINKSLKKGLLYIIIPSNMLVEKLCQASVVPDSLIN